MIMENQNVTPDQEKTSDLYITREYLRRALLKLKKATEFFDQEMSDVEEEEESITKFIAEVKRKKLV